MIIGETSLKGVLLIEPQVFGDERGFFMELWNEERMAEQNIAMNFKQDNVSSSSRGVLRGLHFQNPRPQGKMITILDGEVYDVAVDLRKSSPTFGQFESFTLDSIHRKVLYIPPGFAHGFLVTSEKALFLYKCTDTYYPEGECTLKWDDPALNIPWPIDNPVLSAKDENGFLLKDLPSDKIFT